MTERATTENTVTTLNDCGVATVTIGTADPINLITTPLIEDVTKALADLAERDRVRVLVLRSRGDHTFLAGADVNELAGLHQDTAEEFIGRLATMCEAARRFPTPVIARLSGWCLGGGLELAAACDIRICSTTAHFGMPEVGLGIPSVIHAALLPRLIGRSRAASLLLQGLPIDATTALAWGLVTQVCAATELDDTIDAVSRRFTELGPAVLRQQKRLLRSWEDTATDSAINASVREFGSAYNTGEPQQFMAEFLRRNERHS